MRGIVTQEMQNDKESVISDSYGESYDQSPDAHDYYGRGGTIARNPLRAVSLNHLPNNLEG